ncbi:hypothetical protein CL633_00690 [bacterium]|nr:hypothetical protein [bacterium]|tara:strand:- start:6485 stop:6997 length:513 start_codon:yes stop_codon:yes gene_type:complete
MDTAAVVSKFTDVLHNDSFHKADINKQCYQRFGLDWDETREKVYEQVSIGFELLPGLIIDPEFLIQGIGPKAGNWMVNRFLYVIYLSYTQSRHSVECAVEKLHATDFNEDDFREISRGDFKNGVTWNILKAAREFCPEKVAKVLQSHGLKEKKGFRMKGTEIIMHDVVIA